MRVLHIVGGMNVGGTETMLMNLYRNIDRDKYEFHFISYYDKKAFYDDEIERLGGKIIPMKFSNRFGAIASILQLRKLIKENNYEIVHSHTLFNCGIGVLAAYLGGAKIRISHAHTVFEEKNSFVKKMYAAVMRKLIRKYSTDFLACSERAGAFLFGKDILKEKNYSFLPNYVDYRKYMNDIDGKRVRAELKIEEDEIVLGHVGRLIPLKNHLFILDIVKRMKDSGKKVKAIFVGDGDQRENIESKIKEYGLEENIIITGMVSNPERYMKSMDIFLLPSIYEGFGLVLLEAQASGLQCLVSENIQDETDLNVGLVKKLELGNGAEAWSEEITKMIENRKNISREKIEEAFVEKGYDLEGILRKIENIYGRKI